MEDNPTVLASIFEKEAAKIRRYEARRLYSEHEVNEETLETKEILPKIRH